MTVDRKALIREYKQAARPMGVYRVTDTVTGQSLVGWSLDLTARLKTMWLLDTFRSYRAPRPRRGSGPY